MTDGAGPTPYLARLARTRPDVVADIAARGPHAVARAAVDAAMQAPCDDLDACKAALRRAKQACHLALATGDLSGALDLDAVTGTLSDLADAAAVRALAAACAHLARRGRTAPPAEGERGPAPGFFLLAMGKHGARELNYSSDIDITAFFDREVAGAPEGSGARAVYSELVRLVAAILEEVTPDGYVFRVDLRLRPDPGSTAPAVSVQAAETYYESFGQNWERAALIKARPIAGDMRAADGFLTLVEPFIWRRHLDYAAIADIQSILAQIHAHGRHAGLDDPSFDVKLGRGGIREIEFYVQTRQLILGGRDRRLRDPRTLHTLQMLADAGHCSRETAADLTAAYRTLRALEHRVQMVNDEQTHRLPADPAARSRIAALAGFGDLAALDARVRAVRAAVQGHVAALLGPGGSLADEAGSLVFTGVDDDPDTLETLGAMGFAEPGKVAAAIRGWHHGRIRAMRTARARELFTRLTPALLRGCARTGEPDLAFQRFADFFAALPAGVQVLALLESEQAFRTVLLNALTHAPRIAAALSRRPALLEAVIEPQFAAPLADDAPGGRLRDLGSALRGADGFEAALDAVRRAHREAAFRIDWQVIAGLADARAAGRAYADLAEAAVRVLLPVARAEVARRHGDPEVPLVVAGWGKLGGREMAATSDLDLIVVYDPPSGLDATPGPSAISIETWATRVTQRLVTALSAQTGEGAIYETDLQLRPSGNAGPVAVRLSAFRDYYSQNAWTWELMALTRLRPIAGDPAVMAALEDARREALSQPRDRDALRADAADMRLRLTRERPGRGDWDLKLSPGGLVDLEFIAQTCALAEAPGAARPGTLDTLRALADAGVLDPGEAAGLEDAGQLMLDLRQVLAVAVAGRFDPESASRGLARLVARAAHAPDLAVAQRRLEAARSRVGAAFARHVGRAATE
jgi:glutamate-ammonia-ligase adenylyltransferase